MNIQVIYGLVGTLSVALLAYLVYALLCAEEF